MATYSKPPLSSSDLVSLASSRGLVVSDTAKVQKYFDSIGYHRLSAYFIPFYVKKDVFKPKTTFDDILDLYIFDRKLRLLTLDAVQRIEIAVRAAISNYMSLRYDAFWMLNHKLFRNIGSYQKFQAIALEKAGRNCAHPSQACKNYFSRYGDKDLPPSWITTEELSMGIWSKLFSNLDKARDKKAIAANFQISYRDFASWIKSVTIIRNALAHQKRFWNATFPFTPAEAAIRQYAQGCGPIAGPYTNFVIINTFLKRIINQSSWAQRLAEYLENNSPFDYHCCMKFPVGWQHLPFWQ